MKKFSKILTLLLAVLTILTVFTVVTLASDEEPTFTAKVATSINFESYSNNATIFNDSAKYGKFTAIEQDDGNVYALVSYENNTSNSNNENYDFNTSNVTYNFANYPIMAFDFDVMSPTGKFEYGYLHLRMYNGSTSLGYLGNGSRIFFSELGLKNEAYVWHHITVACELDAQKNVVINVFADGKQVNQLIDSTYTSKITAAGYDASGVRISYAKFSGESLVTTHTSAFDNILMTYYTEGATLKDVATHYYSEEYVNGLYTQTAATGVAADGSTLYYDSIQEAVNATAENGTIVLTKSATSPVIVDKAINIVAGNYTLLYSTSKGYAPSVTEGTYTFAKASQTATVNWATFDVQSTVALGVIPAYIEEIPETITADGLKINLLGWSLENDGTADVLSAISEADVAAGAITLYPIYDKVQYAAEILHKGGFNIGYVMAENFVSTFSTLPTDRTVKLLDDVVIDAAIALKSGGVKITIDLNGHMLTRNSSAYTDYAATWDESSGTYVKGEKISTPASVGDGHLISYNIANSRVTIKSSVPGAVLTVSKVTANRWIYNGEVVNSDTRVVRGGGIGSFSGGVTGTELNIQGDNITFYVGYIGFVEYGGMKATIDIDGGTFVKLPNGYAMFNMLRPGTYSAKNAKFYGNGASLVRTTDYNTSHGESVKVTFDNCDVINANLMLGYSPTSTGDVVTFNNSRVSLNAVAANSTGGYGKIVFGKGTKATSIASQVSVIDDSLEIAALSSPVTTKFVQKTGYAIDTITLLPTGAPTVSPVDCTFNYAVTTKNNTYATVTWKDADGYTLATTKSPKNDTALVPTVYIPESDGYRAIINPNWLDAEGKISNLAIGDDDEYVFTATLEGLSNTNKEYVSYMTDARFNIVYYAHFAYNIYAPVVEGVNIISIGGSAPASTVLINGKAYYNKLTLYRDSTDGITEYTTSIVYSIDGITYTANFKTSALIYAQLIVRDEASSDIEKEAVGCLVRYIEESYKSVSGANLNATVAAKFTDFYTNYYTPAPYTTTYPASTLHNVNDALLEKYIESFEFALTGSRVSFRVILTDSAATAGYKVKATGVTSSINNSSTNPKLFYTNNTPLVYCIMNDVYNIEILDASGKAVYEDLDGDGAAETKVATKYSLATYITAMEAKGKDIALAKALYAFGAAVKEVRNTLY